MQRKLFENESCRTTGFISWIMVTKSTVKRFEMENGRCLQNNRLGEAVKSVRAKMVTRTTAFSLQFHFVWTHTLFNWAPPPQIYSQETGWYGQVEMENGRANCLDRLVPSTPCLTVVGEMQRKLFENESCRTLLASLFKFISWNSGFIYLKRHLTKSTVKRLDDIVTLTGKIDK